MFIGLIPCNEFMTMRPVEIEGNLKDYQRLVGGYIEVAHTREGGLLLLIDEEGKLKGKRFNELATMTYLYGDADEIVGDALFVRLNDAGDDWTGWDTAADVIIAFDKM